MVNSENPTVYVSHRSNGMIVVRVGPLQTALGEYKRGSHEPVTFPMPPGLQPRDWPDLPALRVTPVEHLNARQCERLLSHNHSGDLRLTDAQIAERKKAYWERWLVLTGREALLPD